MVLLEEDERHHGWLFFSALFSFDNNSLEIYYTLGVCKLGQMLSCPVLLEHPAMPTHL
jgi:hypothetical protein